MENDLHALADQLCVVAGMIMEDNNLLAVGTVTDHAARSRRLDALASAADDLTKLVAAARVLARLA